MTMYKPDVPSHFLLFLAGSVWVFVGIMLLLLAFSWLSTASNISIQLFMISGVVLALLIHHYGFLKIADSNLNRILLMDKQSCLFAFIPWKNYLIIAVMITIGTLLRHSSVPKQYLAVLYTGIGLALVLSSVRYFRVFVQIIGR
jgi:hypothetical protein